MQEYLKILLAYQAIPKSRQSRSFMDVAGFPRRETVCSNILAFYFDPSEEHGFGDLLLSALFSMSGVTDDAFPATDQPRIMREYSTAQGKRMDLVIDHPEFTVGIENKIFHWLANDLGEYSQEIDRIGGKKRHKLKVVLGLHPQQGALPGDFRSHTYREFWSHVRERIGTRISNANAKWLTHLIDFMENTETLTGITMELKPADQFFIDHEELINRLNADRNDFYARLNLRVSQLEQLMKDTDEAALLSQPPWVFASRCLVLNFLLADIESVAFDLWLGPSGWELQLFGRGKSNPYVLRLAERIVTGSIIVTANGRCLVQQWPIRTDLGDIRVALCGWMTKLVQAVVTEQREKLGSESQPHTMDPI